MDARLYSRYFKAFGDLSRLKIIRLLADREMTVNEIVAAVRLSQPAVSRHLAILRMADILDFRRVGQSLSYYLRLEEVEDCCNSFCDCLRVRKIEKEE